MSLVREFHLAFDQSAPVGPTQPDSETVRLRMRLIKEEHDEVRAELERLLRPGVTYPESVEIMRDLLKELCDLRYVVEGTAVALGLDIDRAYEEVHRSNMSKLGLDGKPVRRADGKVLKGPFYTPPDLSGIVPSPIEGGLDD